MDPPKKVSKRHTPKNVGSLPFWFESPPNLTLYCLSELFFFPKNWEPKAIFFFTLKHEIWCACLSGVKNVSETHGSFESSQNWLLSLFQRQTSQQSQPHLATWFYYYYYYFGRQVFMEYLSIYDVTKAILNNFELTRKAGAPQSNRVKCLCGFPLKCTIFTRTHKQVSLRVYKEPHRPLKGRK